jgi:hypothetical protein
MAKIIQLIDNTSSAVSQSVTAVGSAIRHSRSTRFTSILGNCFEQIVTVLTFQPLTLHSQCLQLEFAAVVTAATAGPLETAKIIQLIDNTPQQSHKSSQQPRNPPQKIYEFHFNPRQLLGTNRHLSAVYFVA